jgi:hypothetical protein
VSNSLFLSGGVGYPCTNQETDGVHLKVRNEYFLTDAEARSGICISNFFDIMFSLSIICKDFYFHYAKIQTDTILPICKIIFDDYGSRLLSKIRGRAKSEIFMSDSNIQWALDGVENGIIPPVYAFSLIGNQSDGIKKR